MPFGGGFSSLALSAVVLAIRPALRLKKKDEKKFKTAIFKIFLELYGSSGPA